MTGWSHDVRLGIRALFRRPAFSALVVAVIAVGIGSSAALFSLVEACLLKSNTYPVVDRWDLVRGRQPAQNANFFLFSVPEYRELRSLTDIFEDAGALRWTAMAMSAGEYPERVGAARVTANMIPMTGVAPILGRTFRPEEDRPGGGSPVAVLSYELWKERLGADPKVLGRVIPLDGRPHTVIGVMPPHYGLWGAQLWVPLGLDLSDPDRSSRHMWVVVNRRVGVSQQKANARLAGWARQLERDHGGEHPEYRGLTLSVWNINEAVIGGIKPALLLLLGAVALLLATAGANVANLLLVRSTARAREFTIRMALGAGRSRVLRQLVCESFVLAAAGAAAGILVAWAALPAVVRAIPGVWLTADRDTIRLDLPVLAAVASLTVILGVLLGLLPALEMSRRGTRSLSEASTRLSGDGPGRRARNVLIVAEIALSLVVLCAAALMIQTYRRLQTVELGIRPDRVLAFEVALPESRYPRAEQIGRFYSNALDRISRIPGVEAAGAVNGRPLADRGVDGTTQDITLEGRVPGDPSIADNANFRIVSPGFFATMGIRLRRGRLFTDADAAASPPVAIVNEAFTRRFLPGRDPVGRRLRLGNLYQLRGTPLPERQDEPVTIIGVVADVKQLRVIDAPVRQEFFLPQAQRPGRFRAMNIVVRTSSSPLELVPALRRAIASVDPGQPIYDPRAMSDIVADAYGPKRLTTWLLIFFAAVAGVLSALGLSTILAFSVGRRTREIGIRMVSGALPGDIVRLVVGEGARLALVGVGVGAAASLALTRLIAGLLYGVGPSDPVALIAASLLLLAGAAAACFVPARRAARIDPMTALRS